MHNFAELKRNVAADLASAGIERGEATREAELIVEHATGLSAAGQILKADVIASTDVEAEVARILSLRRERMPLQYCLGYAHFLGLKLAVEPGVFIPRTDTETVAEVALSKLAGRQAPSLCEIGPGTGAIGIYLITRLPSASLTAIDISPLAVEVTRKNASAQKVLDRIQVVRGDWRDCLPGGLDLIVSNPPYIPRSEEGGLDPEVRLYEPASALYGSDEDGLGFYRAIARHGGAHLKADGYLVVEVGDRQSEPVCAILKQSGWQHVAGHDDVNGLGRAVSAMRPSSDFENS